MPRFQVKPLFDGGSLRDYLEAKRLEMRQQIEQYPPNQLLNASIDDLSNYFAALARVEPIELRNDEIETDQGETKVDVSQRFEYAVRDLSRPHFIPATSISLHIPFQGDRNLLGLSASTISIGGIYAAVINQEIIFEFISPNADPSQVKQGFSRELNSLRQHVEWTKRDVERHNNELESEATRLVESRRQRLLANQNLVASLGFPIRARSDTLNTYSLPDIRRKVAPTPPPSSNAPFIPEPTLSDAIYEQILGIMSNMVRVMEQSPGAFATMNEEDLRTHFLVQLNGQFEGRATGETFNGSGSTDILLREQDKSVFIAECKFWKGPGSIVKAIDQLLDYATWRDAKAALLVFNRNKDFSAVVAQVLEVIRAHPNTKGEVVQLGDTVFRSKLRLRDDASREIILTTMVFDVPTERSTSDRLRPRRK